MHLCTSGTLEKREILQGLRTNKRVRKYMKESETLAPLLKMSTWKVAFNEMDTDKDGKIEFKEFAAFARSSGNVSDKSTGIIMLTECQQLAIQALEQYDESDFKRLLQEKRRRALRIKAIEADIALSHSFSLSPMSTKEKSSPTIKSELASDLKHLASVRRSTRGRAARM